MLTLFSSKTAIASFGVTFESNRCGARVRSAERLLSVWQKNKKGRIDFTVAVYGRLLSIIRINTPTTAIAMIMPATEGRKYVSDSKTGIGVGAAVEAGTPVTTA